MRLSRTTLAKLGLTVVSALALGACSGGLNVQPDLSAQSENSISTWQGRLETQLSAAENTEWGLKKMAGTGELYTYARNLNNGLTSLSAAYRVNSDPDTARYIRDVLAVARSKLKDEHRECPNPNNTTSGKWDCLESEKTKIVVDGYQNFIYNNPNADSTSRPFNRTDWHEMDEMLTHAGLAGAVYTLKQAGYTTDATFWTDYLKNDFEAKWRKREGKASGFPFLTKKLTHAYAQWIRYHYYMHKLTGDSAYYNEASRMAGHVRNFMLERADGGYTWGHTFGEGTKSTSSTCQPTVYIRYTMQAFQDLNMIDTALFSNTFLTKVAKTMTARVLKTGWQYMADDVCGNNTYSARWAYAQYPYAAVAAWDASGTLESEMRLAYSHTINSHYNAPAMMILSLGR